MNLQELENEARKLDGYEWTVKHTITIEPDETEEKLEDLTKSIEMLLWQITKNKDMIPDNLYKYIYENFVIELYMAGVKEVHCSDNQGNLMVFDIQEIYEKEICEDF